MIYIITTALGISVLLNSLAILKLRRVLDKTLELVIENENAIRPIEDCLNHKYSDDNSCSHSDIYKSYKFLYLVSRRKIKER